MSSSVTRFRSIRENRHYIYLYIELEFASKESNEEIIEREFKLIIMSSMKSLFGDFGSKIVIDLIKYRESDSKAFIRTNARDLVEVINGLTVASHWNQRVCAFRINKICHSLSSLAIESMDPLIID